MFNHTCECDIRLNRTVRLCLKPNEDQEQFFISTLNEMTKKVCEMTFHLPTLNFPRRVNVMICLCLR